MNSKDYWEKREKENLRHYISDEKEYDREIERIYRDMLENVQKEIDSFYRKYADKEGVSIAEARKRVSALDIEAYERKAKRYVRDKDFSKQANEEMRIYNLTMKVNRLEMLKANVGLELLKGHSELEAFMGKTLRGRTEEELKRQAGILGKTIKNNAQAAHAIPNASYKNATFSNRIWMYHDMMKSDLGKMLRQGIVQGKSARTLAAELEKYYIGEPKLKNGKKGAKYNAERLMRSELARVQTEAQRQSFVENGFELYRFIHNSHATRDGNETCSDCVRVATTDSGHGAGVYKIEDLMPGTNAPPLHPHCRCSIAAYEDSDEYEAWLDYLEAGGTTAEWNKTGKANWLKSREKPTRADVEKEIADTKKRIGSIDTDIYEANSKIDKFNSHDFDDIAELKKSDIESKLKVIEDRFAELNPISDRYYNRPERGTPEYDEWREWRRSISFQDIMDEQMRLGVEKANLESQLRKFKRYDEWKQWKKENPLDQLEARRDALLKEKKDLNDSLPKLQRKLVEVVVDDSEVGKAYKNLTYECKVILKDLIDKGVDYNPVQSHSKPQGAEKIIQDLSGGDRTQGSCASVGLAYIGQKGGLNVLDFRDGKSRSFFSNNYNLRKISELPGAKTISETARSSVTAGNKLLKQVEVGKEYYLCCGRHASIVRKTDDGKLQYLELQSATRSGWTDFDGNPRYTLKWRFGENKGYDVTDYMIEVDSLKDSDDLKALLGYINTAKAEQRKGKHGTIK